MTGRVPLDGWWMGAMVAHRMWDRGVRYEQLGGRYSSLCGLALERSLRQRRDGVGRCRHCARVTGEDPERLTVLGALEALLAAFDGYIDTDDLEPLSAAVGAARQALGRS